MNHFLQSVPFFEYFVWKIKRHVFRNNSVLTWGSCFTSIDGFSSKFILFIHIYECLIHTNKICFAIASAYYRNTKYNAWKMLAVKKGLSECLPDCNVYYVVVFNVFVVIHPLNNPYRKKLNSYQRKNAYGQTLLEYRAFSEREKKT